MITLIVISSAINLLLMYGVFNSIKKVERYEDIVQVQVGFMQNIADIIVQSHKQLQELDHKGSFQSDDELGQFFNHMKAVQEELNKYKLQENYAEKKSEQ